MCRRVVLQRVGVLGVAAALAVGCDGTFSVILSPPDQCFQQDLVETDCFTRETVQTFCDDFGCYDEVVIEEICDDVVVDSFLVCD